MATMIDGDGQDAESPPLAAHHRTPQRREKDPTRISSPSSFLQPSENAHRPPAGAEEEHSTKKASVVSAMGLKVLMLLAIQNCSKNLLLRYVMKGRPQFLTSAAVIGSECIKLTLSVAHILLVEKRPLGSIKQYFRDDAKNTLLVAVPATAYNIQTSLEYVALGNLDAAVFSVLVQTKLLFTATFAYLVLRKKLKVVQVVSLVLLTAGVMLCNMRFDARSMEDERDAFKGICATLGIALSSGFASVYTEKVIKTHRAASPMIDGTYSLSYTQVQLAAMSLVTIGLYAFIHDFEVIVTYGLFYNFNFWAFLTVLNSAIGGLIVAGVLKYADSILKGYATAISVIATGLLSMVLFGTELHSVYFMGILNVVVAVFLYNGKNLERSMC